MEKVIFVLKSFKINVSIYCIQVSFTQLSLVLGRLSTFFSVEVLARLNYGSFLIEVVDEVDNQKS